jgi:hypothetical protein
MRVFILQSSGATRSYRPSGPPSLLYNAYRVFPGGKPAGAWRWPPTPSSAEVKETLDLYLYSTSGPSWPVLEWIIRCTETFDHPVLPFVVCLTYSAKSWEPSLSDEEKTTNTLCFLCLSNKLNFFLNMYIKVTQSFLRIFCMWSKTRVIHSKNNL